MLNEWLSLILELDCGMDPASATWAGGSCKPEQGTASLCFSSFMFNLKKITVPATECVCEGQKG